ncbi:DoxX family protein [Primorskyibacter aestuariivivens]|uniref:DoxX family protein n=1 Tax=Primorskyibacter aestuariivivens TaxID=1888912 RepID=UPI0022FFD220|nr:DoxX family protein [Primorskyibacter aestuariivivens]MDA7427415.1 DoxX family protein [Primorskyibacter aestuariivivens]
MTALVNLHNMIFDAVERGLSGLLPLLSRFVFAAVLFVYFWNSALTKLGDGIFGIFQPSVGAYAQIFPKAMEAVTYDVSQLSFFHYLVVMAGTWAEFILPILIVVGLFTRLAALGMIGFIAVQSLTDLYGHGGIEHAETLGAWFDRIPDAVILDQRAFWVLTLTVLVIKGAGALSLDRILSRQVMGQEPATA